MYHHSIITTAASQQITLASRCAALPALFPYSLSRLTPRAHSDARSDARAVADARADDRADARADVRVDGHAHAHADDHPIH